MFLRSNQPALKNQQIRFDCGLSVLQVGILYNALQPTETIGPTWLQFFNSVEATLYDYYYIAAVCKVEALLDVTCSHPRPHVVQIVMMEMDTAHTSLNCFEHPTRLWYLLAAARNTEIFPKSAGGTVVSTSETNSKSMCLNMNLKSKAS